MIQKKENTKSDVSQKKQSKLTFPWWCIFLAYFLSILLVGISILFITVRAIELKDVRTQQWLTSVLIGFFSSVCLTEPIKVCYIFSFKIDSIDI